MQALAIILGVMNIGLLYAVYVYNKEWGATIKDWNFTLNKYKLLLDDVKTLCDTTIESIHILREISNLVEDKESAQILRKSADEFEARIHSTNLMTNKLNPDTESVFTN